MEPGRLAGVAEVMEQNPARAHRAWRNAERIKRLSDDLLKIGPWGIGLDGVLAWVPGANLIYSLGAGGLLLFEGVRAGASPWTLTRMGTWLALNSLMTGVPVVGWALDTAFRGHLMAARALQKDIETRVGAPVPPPRASGATEHPHAAEDEVGHGVAAHG